MAHVIEPMLTHSSKMMVAIVITTSINRPHSMCSHSLMALHMQSRDSMHVASQAVLRLQMVT
jgi:hypothetical protein